MATAVYSLASDELLKAHLVLSIVVAGIFNLLLSQTIEQSRLSKKTIMEQTTHHVAGSDASAIFMIHDIC